jgi:Protein of unknown function (DUF1465)/Tubulin folding cofactor D C terminal
VGALCDSLLLVWHRHAKSTRLATPLLQTADCLLQRRALRLSDMTSDQAQAFLHRVKEEGRNCSDLLRLSAVVSVLCHFAAAEPVNVQKSALQVRADAPHCPLSCSND